MSITMTFRHWLLVAAFVLIIPRLLFANGGAERLGVPSTGNAAASTSANTTNVTIEEESLVIDLHQEFAEVDVRYRMHNAGAAVAQEFFFPVERWLEDLPNYSITADGQSVSFSNVGPPDAKSGGVPRAWVGTGPSVKTWKRSQIPFSANQYREIHITYRCPYDQVVNFVEGHSSAKGAIFAYALSPAATWNGPIGKGRVTINVVNPVPEELRIPKPAGRFRMISPGKYEWSFENLQPTLDDDIVTVVHPPSETFSTRGAEGVSRDADRRADYLVQGSRYFLVHTDYDARASSTLKSDGTRNYQADNIRGRTGTWAEGIEGDGLGESLTLTPRRALPLDRILISPGYDREAAPDLWWANNRVAKLEVVLNGEHSFTATIPDERFAGLYPIPIRGYSKPVKSVQLIIRGVYPGTKFRDTCISKVTLQAKLAAKPKIQPSR